MKSPQFGLVLKGKASACPLTRLANLPEWLGPVKARAYRQASRFVNSRRAGFPVHDYSELAGNRFLIISAPPYKLDVTLREMTDAGICWRRKRVVLCGSDAGGHARRDLEQRGAQTLALKLLDDSQRLWFLIDGAPALVQNVKRLVESGGGRITEVSPGSLGLCGAAISFATWLLLPSIAASVQSFRRAGLSPGRAAPLVEQLVERSVRAYLKGGARAWKPPRDSGSRAEFLEQVAAMYHADPELAESLVVMAKTSLSRAGISCDWLGEEAPLAKTSTAGA